MKTTEYESNKRHAEECSERADAYNTASSHRKAAVAHLLAMGHAEMAGEKTQAKWHDARADKHLAKMRECADYDPDMEHGNFTIPVE